MKSFAGLALLCVASVAAAQGTIPWGQAVSVPELAGMPNVALFYVASYSWVGIHTDYDMARRAADAFLAAHPQTPTYLVLSPGGYQTCDDVPLPAVVTATGNAATISIIGYGSNISSIMKRAGCGVAMATLNVRSAGALAVQGATFQGFTINANHIDNAACGFYGLQNSSILDLGCGNAVPGADHELEFGNLQPNAIGQDVNLNLYNLKAFDSVGVGKGALVMPTWSGGALDGGTLVSSGSKAYTEQYTRVQMIGPGLSTCTTKPTATVNISAQSTTEYKNLPPVTYGRITGVTITNPGQCASTDALYFLIQDGVPVTYGMKFTNLNASHVWNLETTVAAVYGEGWLPHSSNNAIFGEHPYTNQTIQIAEDGNANKHTSVFFDGPGEYAAEIGGRSGRFADAVFAWDGSTYLGSSGYFFGSASGIYSGWILQNSQCTNSNPGFVSVSTPQGALQPSAQAPSGVTLNDIEACDGSMIVNWPTQTSPY